MVESVVETPGCDSRATIVATDPIGILEQTERTVEAENDHDWELLCRPGAVSQPTAAVFKLSLGEHNEVVDLLKAGESVRLKNLAANEKILIHLRSPSDERLDLLAKSIVNPALIREIKDRDSLSSVSSKVVPEPGNNQNQQMRLRINRLNLNYDQVSSRIVGVENTEINIILGEKYTIVIHDGPVPEIDRIIEGLRDGRYEDLVDCHTPFLSDVVSAVMHHNADCVVSELHESIILDPDKVNFRDNRWPHFCSRLEQMRTCIDNATQGIDKIAIHLARFARLNLNEDRKSGIHPIHSDLNAVGSSIQDLKTQIEILSSKIERYQESAERVKKESKTPFEKLSDRFKAVTVINAGLFFIKPNELLQTFFDPSTSLWMAVGVHAVVSLGTFLLMKNWGRHKPNES